MNLRFIKKRLAFLLIYALLTTIMIPPLTAGAEEVSFAALSAAAEPETPSENKTVSGDVSRNATPSQDELPPLRKPDRLEEWDIASADGVMVGSLSADFTLPAAFLSKKKLVLNGMRRMVSADTYLVMNVDGDYELSGLESRNGLDISVNKVSYNGLPAYRISVTATSDTPKGSCRFEIIPKVKSSGRQLKKQKLLVSVKKKNPSVKWEKSLVVLNSSVKGDFALNMPNVEGVSILSLSGNSRYKAKVPAGINVKLQNENTVRISAGKGVKLNKSYVVQLWLVYADSTNVKTVKRKFKVRVTDKSKSIKLKKKKGSKLDLSERSGTAFHYRPVIKNTGLVLSDISFKDGSISDNYLIDKVPDPVTGEITDFYVRAKEGAKLVKGKNTFNFDMELRPAGIDAGTVKSSASFKARKTSSRLKLTLPKGKTLKVTGTLSDNRIVGTVDLRVSGPKYAVIDKDSIKDLTGNSAFSTYWLVDESGQAARIRVVIDKSKVTPGKKYKLVYSLKALGADSDTKPVKITVKYKA